MIVFQMQFDKTKWSCSWNSAEIRLSYQLYQHMYYAVFERQSSHTSQDCIQNYARATKIWCLKLDLMQLFPVRSLLDVQENYS